MPFDHCKIAIISSTETYNLHSLMQCKLQLESIVTTTKSTPDALDTKVRFTTFAHDGLLWVCNAPDDTCPRCGLKRKKIPTYLSIHPTAYLPSHPPIYLPNSVSNYLSVYSSFYMWLWFFSFFSLRPRNSNVRAVLLLYYLSSYYI